MNSNSNAALSKMVGSLNEKSASGSAKDQRQVYESVLLKLYQIIQTFLDKVNSLYIKNEDFENAISSIQDKIGKMETGNENLHYQFRTTHLMIDKKLNTIATDYTNISEQVRMIRRQLPVDSYLESEHFLSKSVHLKHRKQKRKSKRFKLEEGRASKTPMIIVNESKQLLSCDKRQSKAESTLVIVEGSDFLNLQKSKKAYQTCKSIEQSQVEMEIESELEGLSPENLAENKCKKQESIPKDEARPGVIYDIEWVENEIQKHMQVFNQRTNMMMEQWIQQKQKMKCQVLIPQAQQFFATFDDKMQASIKIIKELFEQQQMKMKKQIQAVNQTSLKNIGALQYKLSQKIEKQYFEQSMNNLTSALSAQLSNNQKQFSNKTQTQRAIKFLQNKINKIIEQQQVPVSPSPKSIKQINENQPFLRINKCQSQKKLQNSQPANTMLLKTTAQQVKKGFRSLNQSSNDIEIYEKCSSYQDNKVNISFIKQKNTKRRDFNGDPSLDTGVQSKIRKSSLFKSKGGHIKFGSANTSLQDQATKEKQWKEKVVKVLQVGDRKKVKVTFH